MAGYNQIHGEFWDDKYVETLDASECLLYNFFLTGPMVNSAGLYKITERKIAYYGRTDIETAHRIVQKFVEDGKIAYDGEVLWVKNYHKYNKWMLSPNAVKFVKGLLETIEVSEVKTAFVDFFRDVFSDNTKKQESVSEQLDTNIETVSKHVDTPSDTLSKPIQIPLGTTIQLNNYTDKQIVNNSSFEKLKVSGNENIVSDSQAKSERKQKSAVSKKSELTPEDSDWWNRFGKKKELAIAFYRETNMFPTSNQWGHWQKDLDQFIEANISVDVMIQAIRKIKAEGRIEYKTPGSVFSTARWLMTNQQTVNNNSQQIHQPKKAYTYADIFAIENENNSGEIIDL